MNSCDGNPFMTNLFSSFDYYELPSSFSSAGDLLDAPKDELLDALGDSIDQDFIDNVISLLEEAITTPASEATSEDQEAALLLADVYLVTTDADDTVNNVNDLLLDAVSDPDSLNFDNPEDIITDLFALDESLTPGQQEDIVEAQLLAFLGAADALGYYGETMIEGLGTNPDVNTGDTAATAMIAGMTSYFIENAVVDSSVDPVVPLTQEQAIAAIRDSIVYGTDMPDMAPNPTVDDALTTEDMLNAMLGDGLAEVVGDGFDLGAFDGMGE
ncbi:MAG: hypothetical protein PF518_08125 [Spirochaetaceae bacterium]|nr:hypothetical protein [Spirochaetaceae bacterium]